MYYKGKKIKKLAPEKDIIKLSEELNKQQPLKEKVDGVNSYINLKKTAEKLNFEASWSFKNKCEVWIKGESFESKRGVGNSLKEAVEKAIELIHLKAMFFKPY